MKYTNVKIKKDHKYALEIVLELIRYYHARQEPIPTHHIDELLRLFEFPLIPSSKYAVSEMEKKMNSEIQSIQEYRNNEYDILERLDRSMFDTRIRMAIIEFYSFNYSFLKSPYGEYCSPDAGFNDLQHCHSLIFMFNSGHDDSIEGILTDRNSNLKGCMRVRQYRYKESYNEQLFRLYTIIMHHFDQDKGVLYNSDLKVLSCVVAIHLSLIPHCKVADLELEPPLKESLLDWFRAAENRYISLNPTKAKARFIFGMNPILWSEKISQKKDD